MYSVLLLFAWIFSSYMEAEGGAARLILRNSLQVGGSFLQRIVKNNYADCVPFSPCKIGERLVA